LFSRIDLISSFFRGAQPFYQSTLKPRNAVSVDKLTSGFLARDVIWNMSTDLMRVLDDFCALSELIDTRPGTILSRDLIYARYEADLQLPSLRQRDHAISAPVFDEPGVQECVAFAAEVYWRCVITEPPHARATSRPLSAANLAAYVAGIARLMVSAKRDAYLELLFWMIFIGNLTITTAGTTTAHVDTNSFWAHLMAGIAKELGVAAWEDARAVLRRFLWSNRRCEGVGRELWLAVRRRAVRAGEGRLEILLGLVFRVTHDF
jgi:hypothetical protein